MDYSPPGSSIHGILQAGILSGLPCPPPGDLPNPGTEPTSPIAPAWPLDSLLTEPSGSPLSLFTSLPNLQTARSCYSQGAIVENPLREKEIIQSLFQGYHVAFCLGNLYFRAHMLVFYVEFKNPTEHLPSEPNWHLFPAF